MGKVTIRIRVHPHMLKSNEDMGGCFIVSGYAGGAGAGYGGGFALIVVLFILLIIVGVGYVGYGY